MASLSDAFLASMAARAERGAPGGPRETMERYGWTTGDIAREFGVSPRTARRWHQQDRIPARQAENWRAASAAAAQGRQRARMERRGLSGMRATGTYEVSPGRRFRTRPGYPVKTPDGVKIPAAALRDYFGALDQGAPDLADQILNDALAHAYDAEHLTFIEADNVDYTI